jgi:hypothetical protein
MVTTNRADMTVFSGCLGIASLAQRTLRSQSFESGVRVLFDRTAGTGIDSQPATEGTMNTFIGVAAFSLSLFGTACSAGPPVTPATQAPTGFDNKSNGVADDATHQADQASFEQFEAIADGLGPLFNAQSCREPRSSRGARWSTNVPSVPTPPSPPPTFRSAYRMRKIFAPFAFQ